MANPPPPPCRATPVRAWCALALAVLALAPGPIAAQQVCAPPAPPPGLATTAEAPTARRAAVLDALLADAEAARALDEAGHPDAARILMAVATSDAEALLLALGGRDDPALGGVMALGTARDVLARIIAAAMLADEIPPDLPPDRLARAMALLAWSADAWRAAMACGGIANAALAARSHGALARADALLRDAFATSPDWDASTVRAIATTMAALTDLMPATVTSGDAWPISPDQLDAAVAALRASAGPLLLR